MSRRNIPNYGWKGIEEGAVCYDLYPSIYDRSTEIPVEIGGKKKVEITVVQEIRFGSKIDYQTVGTYIKESE